MISELLTKISKEEVSEIQEELVELYKMELLSRKVYFEQIRKLDGVIVETLKILLEQETEHANTLIKILAKNFYKEKKEEYSYFNADNNLIKAVNFDLVLEEDATKKYEQTIKKSSSENLKKILTHILEEEFNHIKRLEKFVGKK